MIRNHVYLLINFDDYFVLAAVVLDYSLHFLIMNILLDKFK